ncbi:receptor family ligand binding protein [Micromonospora kangleipakensis]|uniref:Receptor family ligand binding protein n=1 Tax=Micromonospora kangleipakensis TaxID=1077942 RepID=A0A4Q8B724_9ACTN|nr:hypothetical protein [Micromonospora kangleipakensis]RZU73208.1 receptor family ligand binding protein [Micromonospora kangleipakensis]
MATIGVAQKLQVPFLSFAAGDDIVLPLAQRTYIYKLTPDAGDVARRLARLIDSQRLRRIALLAADGLHGDSGVRAMRGALRTADVELTASERLPARVPADRGDRGHRRRVRLRADPARGPGAGLPRHLRGHPGHLDAVRLITGPPPADGGSPPAGRRVAGGPPNQDSAKRPVTAEAVTGRDLTPVRRARPPASAAW